jgi:hypothetical protein
MVLAVARTRPLLAALNALSAVKVEFECDYLGRWSETVQANRSAKRVLPRGPALNDGGVGGARL